MLSLEEKIHNLIAEDLAHQGFEVVRVQFFGGHKKTLQIMIDKLDNKNEVNVDDCAEVSTYVSALLDVEDVIADEYNLEISSPGIDRPLVKIKDFENYVGFDVKMTLHEKVDNFRKFSGVISAVEENKVFMDIPSSKMNITVEFANIASAKLILTDQLINFKLKRKV